MGGGGGACTGSRTGIGPKEPQARPDQCCSLASCSQRGLLPFQLAEILVKGRGQKSPVCSPPSEAHHHQSRFGLVSPVGPKILLYCFNPLVPLFTHVFNIRPCSLDPWRLPSVTTAVSCLALLSCLLRRFCPLRQVPHKTQEPIVTPEGSGLKERIIQLGRKTDK